ncbi:hypothetical protein [Streptomyces sp. NRRL B-24720]|uniref:hypothetical protein n=1 Tax=Streptomyces sp. NRRL B-24720 TaxID=1476876 RepID=UPI0004C71079|nr:hypothetical protein [Streptomyces sp. NRRL B-24720]
MPFSTAVRGRARRLTLATSILAAIGAGLLTPAAIALSARPGTPPAEVTAAAGTRGTAATHDRPFAFGTVDDGGVPTGHQNGRLHMGAKAIGPITDTTGTLLLPTDRDGGGTLPVGDGGGIGAGDGCTEADRGSEHRHARRPGGTGWAHRG